MRYLAILFSLPTVFMVAATVWFWSLPDFAPHNIQLLFVYLLILMLWYIPKAGYALCLFVGQKLQKRKKTPLWPAHVMGIASGLLVAILVIYGSFVVPRNPVVRHVTLTYHDLPKAFNGFRMVHISDAHLGTMLAIDKNLFQRSLDSIRAQHPHAVFFTGDLVNLRATEAQPVLNELQSITPSVIAVLGNHDYAHYIGGTSQEKQQAAEATARLEQKAGWTLLRNSHYTLKRSQNAAPTDSIVVVGTENYGGTPDVNRSRLTQAMQGVPPNAFVILLQHNPNQWEEEALRYTNIRLMLSGHTHGGQIQVLGLRPTQLRYPNDFGIYKHKNSVLSVTSGMGALLPFRIGLPPEIVVITLQRTS